MDVTPDVSRLCSSAYLHATANSAAVRVIKRRGYELLALSAGSHVADVGCGPAIDTITLARVVGTTGAVIGVDRDETMVAEANRIADREGVGAIARHVRGDATRLPLETASMDALYCERLFQHLPWSEAITVIREFFRVVRAEGRIVVIDTDWATLSMVSLDPWLERRIVLEHASMFANPFVGRQLPGLLRSSGLVDPHIESFDLQLSFEALQFLLMPGLNAAVANRRMAPVEVQRWLFGIRTLRDYGSFFAHVSMVLISGRVPDL